MHTAATPIRSIKQHHNRQIIHIHLGQFGCQSATTIWELHCKEHGIGLDGTILKPDPTENICRFSNFTEGANGFAKPKCLMIDMELNPINIIQNGRFKNLFDPEYQHVGPVDASSNFARGRYGGGFCGMVLKNTVFNNLRNLLEKCDCAKTCLSFRASAGGCGSGFLPPVLEYMDGLVMSKVLFTLAPSNLLTNHIIAPYNHLFAQAHAHKLCDMVIPLQNSHLRAAFIDHFYHSDRTKVQPITYREVNEEIAFLVSHILTGRFRDGDKNNAMQMSLSGLVHNLIPFRDLKYMTTNVSNTGGSDFAQHNRTFVKEMILGCLRSKLVSCNAARSYQIAMAFSFRGACDVLDIQDNVIGFQEDAHFVRAHKNQFVNYIPQNIKIANYQTPVRFPKTFKRDRATMSCASIINESGIDQYLLENADKFALLYHSGSYVHWYKQEGMDREEFPATFEYMKGIADLYTNVLDAGLQDEEEDEDDMIVLQDDVPADDNLANPVDDNLALPADDNQADADAVK